MSTKSPTLGRAEFIKIYSPQKQLFGILSGPAVFATGFFILVE
jgi:hypothetical protein